MKLKIVLALLTGILSVASAREYHVSPSGNDAHPGTKTRPLRTISAAARLAAAGDMITVHQGVYREQVNPPRGGESDTKRIVYRAAPGEKVAIKGSEIIKGWQRVQKDTWKVCVSNDIFGDFNPYSDVIRGDWFDRKGRDHHTGAVYLNGHWLTEAAKLEQVLKPLAESPSNSPDAWLWFAEAGRQSTTIWAQFKGINPNDAEVEINVRRTVFYPDKPGRNFITVRGFILRHAATPWSPPTAEQIGLIGTHWSKGWIIEDNDIGYSTCVGVTLGKYGDQWDNTSQNSAEGYVKTIERALANGWSKENIGHHVVRNNHIAHCEQAGIVGSLGAAFSSATGNDIHDIHVRELFSGAEMAGIKFHAAIDTEISRNFIHRTCLGLWLDWMTQGTRVSWNVFYDNKPVYGDLLVEVNHGPFLVDNNLFLSPAAVFDMSQGGAYVHNLFLGRLSVHTELKRETPFLKAHSTEVGGLRNIAGGDDRFYNNIFVKPAGLADYDHAAQPMQMGGNVFLHGAIPGSPEPSPVVMPEFDPSIKVVEQKDGVFLRLKLGKDWSGRQPRQLVTTKLLGKAAIPGLPYEKPDGSSCRIDTDFFGKKRNATNPYPGPFELPEGGEQILKIWFTAVSHMSRNGN
jgi:alpha-N-arabinofuranosidase